MVTGTTGTSTTKKILKKDRIATAVATVAGTGYAPIAPGTFGALVGIVSFWPLARHSVTIQCVAALALVIFSIWASDRVSRSVGLKDPSIVVVDEVVGMWVTLIGIPFQPLALLIGFLVFRLFDIIKPPPAAQFEKLRGGWGIVLDDVMAGVYANLVVRVVLWALS